jgi:hypothetical protein
MRHTISKLPSGDDGTTGRTVYSGSSNDTCDDIHTYITPTHHHALHTAHLHMTLCSQVIQLWNEGGQGYGATVLPPALTSSGCTRDMTLARAVLSVRSP